MLPNQENCGGLKTPLVFAEFFFLGEETAGGLCGCLSHQCQWSLAIGGGSWVVTRSIRTWQSKVGASETRHPKADWRLPTTCSTSACRDDRRQTLCPYCALQGLCVPFWGSHASDVFRWLAQAIVPSVELCFQSVFTSLVPSPVSPLLLRHLKADVANHLPDNVEQDWDWEHPPLTGQDFFGSWCLVRCDFAKIAVVWSPRYAGRIQLKYLMIMSKRP